MTEKQAPQQLITHVPGFAAPKEGVEASMPQPEAQYALSPAEALGLHNGEFTVMRSNGEEETGWSVARFAEDRFDEVGDRISRVMITKPVYDSGGHIVEYLEKTIPESRLLSWQKETEEQGAGSGRLDVRLDEPRVTEAPASESERLEVRVDESEVKEASEKPGRVEQLFAPVGVEESHEDRNQGFDHLFDPDYDASKVRVEDAAVRGPEGRQKVTAESEQDAADALRYAVSGDYDLKRIIDQYNPNRFVGQDLVRHLRTDPEARVAVGKYLMSRFEEEVLSMGDRVRHDAGKRPNFKGYEGLGSLKSSEYVPLLALSMIDGTYHEAAADTEQRKDNGAVTNGEHRQAARQILFGRIMRGRSS